MQLFFRLFLVHVITGASAVAATAAVAESQKARPTSAFGRSNDANGMQQQQPVPAAAAAAAAATNSNSFVAIMALLNDLDIQQLQQVQARCQELSKN
jgi:hypothetical protein